MEVGRKWGGGVNDPQSLWPDSQLQHGLDDQRVVVERDGMGVCQGITGGDEEGKGSPAPHLELIGERAECSRIPELPHIARGGFLQGDYIGSHRPDLLFVAGHRAASVADVGIEKSERRGVSRPGRNWLRSSKLGSEESDLRYSDYQGPDHQCRSAAHCSYDCNRPRREVDEQRNGVQDGEYFEGVHAKTRSNVTSPRTAVMVHSTTVAIGRASGVVARVPRKVRVARKVLFANGSVARGRRRVYRTAPEQSRPRRTSRVGARKGDGRQETLGAPPVDR